MECISNVYKNWSLKRRVPFIYCRPVLLNNLLNLRTISSPFEHNYFWKTFLSLYSSFQIKDNLSVLIKYIYSLAIGLRLFWTTFQSTHALFLEVTFCQRTNPFVFTTKIRKLYFTEICFWIFQKFHEFQSYCKMSICHNYNGCNKVAG